MMRRWVILGGMVFCCMGAKVGATTPINSPADVTSTWKTVDGEMDRLSMLVAALSSNKFETVTERNQFVLSSREIGQCADDLTSCLTTRLLQQKISPSDPSLDVKLRSVHRMLFLLQQVKDSADAKVCQSLTREWQEFKVLWRLPQNSIQMNTATDAGDSGTRSSATTSTSASATTSTAPILEGVSITLQGKIGTIVPAAAPSEAANTTTTSASSATSTTATAPQQSSIEANPDALAKAREMAIARARERARARARTRAQMDVASQRKVSKESAGAVADLSDSGRTRSGLAQIPELAR